MSRKEKLAVIILVLIAVVAGAGFLLIRVGEHAAERQLVEERERVKDSVGMNEPLLLDSEEDEKTAVTGRDEVDGFGSYLAGFGFMGSMEVSVSSARLYDDPRKAGIALEDKNVLVPQRYTESKEFDFLLVTFSIKNIDAAPIGKTKAGNVMFNVSGIFTLSPAQEPVYFDGSPAGADESEGNCFYLDKGEEKTFHVGYALQEKDAAGRFVLMGGCRGMAKYSIELDVNDKRGGDA